MNKLLKVNKDERGSFTELWRKDWRIPFTPAEISQSMISISKPNVIRAWHKHERRQDDYLVVISGIVKIVYIETWPFNTRFVEYVVDGKRPELVYIPGNCWHGTQALTDTTTIYFVTQLYDYENPDELRRPPDYDFGWGAFEWGKRST